MRIAAYILTISVVSVLSLGGALLVALAFRDAPDWTLVAASTALPFLVFGPMVLGVLAAFWDPSARDNRTLSLRWFTGVVAVEVVASALVVVASVAARAAWWVPVVVVVAAAVLLGIARPLAALVRRTEPPISPVLVDGSGGLEAETLGVDAATVRRKIRAVVITFLIGAAVVSVGIVLQVVLLPGRGEQRLASTLLVAVQLVFTATALASVMVGASYNQTIRDVGGRDLGRLRRFGRIVVRGQDLALEPGEERAALQYAAVVHVSLRFQTTFLLLLYTGLACQFLSQLRGGTLGVLPLVVLPAMVVVLAVTVPLTVRRIRRARRYVEHHLGDLRAAAEPATSDT